MITPDEYIYFSTTEMRKMSESGHYKSNPKPLFIYDDINDEMVFSPDNWNGCDILRRFFYDEYYPGCSLLIEKFLINYYLIDNTTYIFILDDLDFYIITWYKSRGKTENIIKNGSPITLDEYIELCNRLNITLKGE